MLVKLIGIVLIEEWTGKNRKGKQELFGESQGKCERKKEGRKKESSRNKRSPQWLIRHKKK